MPIYEYRCEACDRTFEVLTSYADREGRHSCPSCDSARTTIMVSSFAAIGAESRDVTSGSSGGCACGGACACGR
ncbi:MAG TPA: zinc ribbon domain-containing protein [Candidatus Dormibacteraeota bacterium]|nr:zinc ribbon domain-containing protein [Candidatus Dormibacteraeota bacterium]